MTKDEPTRADERAGLRGRWEVRLPGMKGRVQSEAEETVKEGVR